MQKSLSYEAIKLYTERSNAINIPQLKLVKGSTTWNYVEHGVFSTAW